MRARFWSRFPVALVLLSAILITAAEEKKDDGDDKAIAEAKKLSVKNLKELGTAMHNYHGDMGCFPAAATKDKDGKPLLSWRVALLPYLEQGELYKQFKLDEPWDSENNKKLIAKMPKVFAPATGPKVKEPVTFYQVLVSTGKFATIFGPKNVTLMQLANSDGLPETIMIVEAGEPVAWTKPEDLLYNEEKPMPKLGGLFRDGFHAAFADVCVCFIKKDCDEKLLRSAITWNDGQKFDFEKLTGQKRPEDKDGKDKDRGKDDKDRFKGKDDIKDKK